MTAVNNAPRCWKLSEWPARDQAAWALGCTPGDPFGDDPRHGATLRPDTLSRLSKDYGRYLCFLAGRGWLDPAKAPLQRVTKARLRYYFRELQASGNADATIKGRFDGLMIALRIMSPGEDVSWIVRPDGATIHSLMERRTRPLLVPSSVVLFAWGCGMMDAARPRAGDGDLASVAYRDGLLIAMLASRARRLRSMSLLRVGHELVRNGPCYRIELAPWQVKTDKRDQFDLPTSLTGYIDHYLAVVRPALLGGNDNDAFWIGRLGRACTAKALQERISVLSRERFGVSFGPHRFRHALATTALLHDPSHPGVPAGLLGISAAVLENHYNHADQIRASTNYGDLIDRQREQARDVR